jgi:hypothetical protein
MKSDRAVFQDGCLGQPQVEFGSPSANRRSPPPRSTGTTAKRRSSIRLARSSAWMMLALLITRTSRPGASRKASNSESWSRAISRRTTYASLNGWSMGMGRT